MMGFLWLVVSRWVLKAFGAGLDVGRKGETMGGVERVSRRGII